jgi:anti-sigma factor RsiW
MKKYRYTNWVRNILNTQEEEISCSECFDRISHYVEVELSGEDASAQMPELKQHLSQCPACREEYETLRDLQRFENEGNAPSASDLRDSIP